MDRALTSTKGLEIELVSEKAAIRMLQRIYSARHQDRKSNAKIYPEGHVLHNKSAYDPLVFVRRGNKILTGVGGLTGLISTVKDLDTNEIIPEEEL